MSNIRQAQNQRGELIENDNWRHFDEYYNISLDEFSNLVPSALEKGYSIAICGDVSEPGFEKLPERPGSPISTSCFPYQCLCKRIGLYNSSTTDDHCMHVVGYTKLNDEEWYLLKDPAPRFRLSFTRIYFIHARRLCKAKKMNLMLHKEAARQFSIILSNKSFISSIQALFFKKIFDVRL
jgi:bleomycin hydrolase